VTANQKSDESRDREKKAGTSTDVRIHLMPNRHVTGRRNNGDARPKQQQPVVCLDEKAVTLRADIRHASPAEPGREARRDSEYERCGTASVFCAVEPKAGRHFTFHTPDRMTVRPSGSSVRLEDSPIG